MTAAVTCFYDFKTSRIWSPPGDFLVWPSGPNQKNEAALKTIPEIERLRNRFKQLLWRLLQPFFLRFQSFSILGPSQGPPRLALKAQLKKNEGALRTTPRIKMFRNRPKLLLCRMPQPFLLLRSRLWGPPGDLLVWLSGHSKKEPESEMFENL